MGIIFGTSPLLAYLSNLVQCSLLATLGMFGEAPLLLILVAWLGSAPWWQFCNLALVRPLVVDFSKFAWECSMVANFDNFEIWLGRVPWWPN